jgi:diguanylate cyclase (GGDEF)-like protein/PAS domain S-box-containing protein
MPPGWDGVETATRLWEAAPDLQVVICTAYADYSWAEMSERLGRSDRWIILKKPFDPVEVLQMANSLTEKVHLLRRARIRQEEVERLVDERTSDLALANAALSESEVRYRRLFESAKDGIIIADALTGRIVDVNPSIMEQLDCIRDDIVGKALWEIATLKDLATSTQTMEELCRSENVRHQDLSFQRKDGSFVTVECVSNTYLVEDKQLIQYDFRDISERKQAEEALKRYQEQLEDSNRILTVTARTDYLTQILNRAAILQRLDDELARAVRQSTPLSVFMVDVDHFKTINDTFGHAAGDQVLIEIAQRLSAACRVYDAVGRYGGEEFLLVVPVASYESTEVIAERFRKCVEANPITVGNVKVSVTVSVGGVWNAPGNSGDVDSIVNMADMMLYQAKEDGRNRVELCPYIETPD